MLWTRLAPRPLEGGGMPESAVAVDWQIAEDEKFCARRRARHRTGHAGAGSRRARRGQGPAARSALLVSLPRRHRVEPDRPHAHGAGGRQHAVAVPLRLRLLPAVRAGLLHRLSRHGPRAISISSCISATTSTRRPGDRSSCASTASASRRPCRSSATATRSTSSIPTCRPPTLPSRGWRPGTITRSPTTTPTTAPTRPAIPPSSCKIRAAAYQAYYEHLPLPALGAASRSLRHHLRPLPLRRHARPDAARRSAVSIAAGLRRRRPAGHRGGLRRAHARGRAACWAASRSSGCDRQIASAKARWTIVAQQTLMAELGAPGRRRASVLDGRLGRLSQRPPPPARLDCSPQAEQSGRHRRRPPRLLRRRSQARLRPGAASPSSPANSSAPRSPRKVRVPPACSRRSRPIRS